MIMRPYKSRLLIGLGAICVLAIAAACGGGAQEDAVTKEDLRSVVQEAMAESAPAPAPAPAGPSAEEMRALVSEAVAAAAPAALGPAEIGAMVEAAVSAFSADTVSGEDIERLVTNAVEEAVSQGPTPLSASRDRGHRPVRRSLRFRYRSRSLRSLPPPRCLPPRLQQWCHLARYQRLIRPQECLLWLYPLVAPAWVSTVQARLI